METDENKIEVFELYEDIPEIEKDNWDKKIKINAPEVGILSMLMLLNDIFLQPYFQSLVNKYLTKKYRNLVLLSHIFPTSKK
ncbi:MAG: hypothetical protein ACTSO9_15990 [Candidatus Helarchaeota archaeon]